MTEKESLLAYISWTGAKAKFDLTYGVSWEIDEARARRSHAAGELCLMIRYAEILDDKAKRRPRSIGARKARQKAKAARKKQRELEKMIVNDCRPWEPLYLPKGLRFQSFKSRPGEILYERTLEKKMPYKAT